MALHFNAIINDYKNADALAWILHDGMDKCDRVFISKDRHYFHLQTPVLDVLSGEEIGSINAGKLLFQIEFMIHWEHPFYLSL